MEPRVVKSFIPIYPNNLLTVPKPPRAGRTASLLFSDLPASQSAITRLLNRCTRENYSEVSSNGPQDVGMHSKETEKTGKKGRVEAVGRDSVGFLPTTGQRSNQLNYVPNRGINDLA
jgi:hypothetical protein